MTGGVMTCNACNKEFLDDSEQKLHYRTEWHRYNLKRKVAGVPGVTEALFEARQSAVAEEQNKLSSAPMLYTCALCAKGYRSSKAHDQHLRSRSHSLKASNDSSPTIAGITIIKPLKTRGSNQPTTSLKEDSEDSEDEWVELGENDDMDVPSESVPSDHVPSESGASKDVKLDASGTLADQEDDMDEDEKLDPSCCFMCDLQHNDVESCMVHMHKKHGFFIPDAEYLKDPKGLITYVGLKVKRDFLCLYCNDNCHPFQSLEAVRKHMVSKAHCKLRYGDGGDDEEAELEEFYDYSSSYVDENGEQLVASDDTTNNVELGSGGAELVITRKTESGISVRALGSREFLRYYRQNPRPSASNEMLLAVSLASRYRSLGLATVQSRKNMVRMKVLKEMNRNGVQAMRSKMGMKSNVIRNLPNNVPY